MLSFILIFNHKALESSIYDKERAQIGNNQNNKRYVLGEKGAVVYC